jgi:small subunit ribosomal protein S2
MAQSELMRQLIEAGAHFGHQTHRWNPKMGRYIFGERSNIHIIDLSQTLPLFDAALQKVREVAAGGGRILFVGTKRQAAEPIAAAAMRCAQYYMNQRWLGGTLTNWNTISKSIARLRELTEITSADGPTGLTKKELLQRTREREKLERSLGGIAGMGGTPDLMFVIDTNKEAIAIQEARKLGIPVVAIVDTNCDPDLIDFPIPGNDDATRAIQMYCDMIADSILEGLEQSQASSGYDIGASENPNEPSNRRRGRGGGGQAPAPQAVEAAMENAEAPAAAAIEPEIPAEA